MEFINGLTFIVSTLAFIVSAWVLILMIQSRRVRLRAHLKEGGTYSVTGWKFKISNVGDNAVTLSKVCLSLHRSKKKEVLWDYHKVIVSGNRDCLLPYRLESNSTVEIRFTYHEGDVPRRQKEIKKIDQQGGGYISITTDCGAFRPLKFKYSS